MSRANAGESVTDESVNAAVKQAIKVFQDQCKQLDLGLFQSVAERLLVLVLGNPDDFEDEERCDALKVTAALLANPGDVRKRAAVRQLRKKLDGRVSVGTASLSAIVGLSRDALRSELGRCMRELEGHSKNFSQSYDALLVKHALNQVHSIGDLLASGYTVLQCFQLHFQRRNNYVAAVDVFKRIRSVSDKKLIQTAIEAVLIDCPDAEAAYCKNVISQLCHAGYLLTDIAAAMTAALMKRGWQLARVMDVLGMADTLTVVDEYCWPCVEKSEQHFGYVPDSRPEVQRLIHTAILKVLLQHKVSLHDAYQAFAADPPCYNFGLDHFLYAAKDAGLSVQKLITAFVRDAPSVRAQQLWGSVNRVYKPAYSSDQTMQMIVQVAVVACKCHVRYLLGFDPFSYRVAIGYLQRRGSLTFFSRKPHASMRNMKSPTPLDELELSKKGLKPPRFTM